ncbi:DUF6445 family protein [Sphingomonas sp.]|uniref:DUF6445 family protein n=1 Tax=Sphingomonas sp. TaxID=28214 RepID=UPI0025D8028B|nr:DUF6445 family protein [Sphingomonas sp.]MBV9528418.1 hypothetical protein [Sphingomonas sp.]
MGLALTVIDDFLGRPEDFRAHALRLNYATTGEYPGRNSIEHIQIEGLERLVSTLVGERVRVPLPLQSHGSCRLTLARDNETRGKIHIDPTHWSGILYLSRPEDCRGGTEFYRHLPSGMDYVPRDLPSLNAVGYASYDDFRKAVDEDSLDRSKWELTMTVPMRFNRLVLLQPQYWHTAGPGFGDSLENGRLVYLMFFKRWNS